MTKEQKKIDQIAIRQRIEVAAIERGLGEENSWDVSFHMMDWFDDLKQWWAFCEDPNSLSVEELDELLVNFLIHVPNHLAAASKLYWGTGVEDIFDVGAVETD